MAQLPSQFLEFVDKHPQLSILRESLLTVPETSIRFNPDKVSDTAALDISKYCEQLVPWCEHGYYLLQRPNFTFDPALHQGLYYVQDSSSMAIAAVIEQLKRNTGNRPLRVLDACAAPGGKTTAILSALPEGSVLAANEYDYKRAEILAENLAKWGYSNVIVTRGDTRRYRKLKDAFDVIVVDAPCSGEGMMRKDEKAIEQWSPRLVEQCAAIQREIVDNVWQALKPGGYLVYSTCTFNTTEDEENLDWIIKTFSAESVVIPALQDNDDIVKGIDTPYHCYRFIPGRVRGEGLFLSVVQKSGAWQESMVSEKVASIKFANKDIEKWIQPGMSMANLADGTICAYPSYCSALFNSVAKVADVIAKGTAVATVKGKDAIPEHALALSHILADGAFPTYELNLTDAIKYLRRDNIVLDDAPKGYVLLTYKNNSLGFVKNLGNRCNSLYPKSWRIISNYP